jgi:signal transduction histidine kinase
MPDAEPAFPLHGPAPDVRHPSGEPILRFLRVALHVGFALLLAVAAARLLLSGAPAGVRYGGTALALVLAAVYVTGTVLEKRSAAGRATFDPHPYAILWLAIVTVLWGILLAVSAEFAWLAFPLFFLHLHLLQRWAALLTVALMTAAVIAAQWAASGLAMPAVAMVLGPVVGAGFSVVTSLAYRALYLDGVQQRLIADELRRTRMQLAQTEHQAGVLTERERLAREIHDTLAQGLSSIVLVSRAADASLAAGDLAVARQQLATVQQAASDNLAEARNFVRGLSSPQLEERPLVESLRRLCEKTEREAAARGVGLRCRFALEGSAEELPQPYTVALLRAAQSSLANVWIHAKASSAVVTLAFLGSAVTLDIYDDGVGFDPAGLDAHGVPRSDGSGYGIRSLRERVAALAGSLDLESAPGEGTVVAIRLPLATGGADPAAASGPVRSSSEATPRPEDQRVSGNAR